MTRSAERTPVTERTSRGSIAALLAVASLLVGTGCGGYALGPTNGQSAGARAIRIGHVANGTDEPRLADTVSHALRAQVHVDGTFRLATRDDGDIVITTALIPGRKAPVLVTEEMVQSMKPGSVIIDMAVEQGGNCPLSEPGKTVTKHGVHIVGETNLPSMVAADASALYARNVLDFLKLVVDADGKLKVDLEDDIVKACLVARDGQVLRA